MPAHIPVLKREVLNWLAPKPGGIYVDSTLGLGGHAEAILEASAPHGVLIGIDRDTEALAIARERLRRFGGRVLFVHGCFGEIRNHLRGLGIEGVDGVIADLGVSSLQLEDAERGFSFRLDGPLDMRMDRGSGLSALEWIQRLNEEALSEVLFRYGEEPKARAIARAIKRAHAQGALRGTRDLAELVWKVKGRRGRRDPATQVFQALRILTNDELGELERWLLAVPGLLKLGGVVVAIAFHSLEDRLIKRAFRSDPRLEPLTRKPLVPGEGELRENPRARSAKLRAARRTEAMGGSNEGVVHRVEEKE